MTAVSLCRRLSLPLVPLLLAGCAAGPRLYINPMADMSYYQKVAVLPFSNLSSQPFAAERVTRAFITELLLESPFQVIEPADYWKEIEALGAVPDNQGRYDPEKLKQVATKIQANGLIRGAVTEYQVQRSAQDEYPVVSFDVELVDAASNNVVWRVSVNQKGQGRLPVVGGGGSRSFGRVTQEACKVAVESLKGKAF